MRANSLAAITDLRPPGTAALPARQAPSPVMSDLLLILAVGLALTAVLALLVYYRYRRKSGRVAGRGLSKSRSTGSANGIVDRGSRSSRQRGRRNPTLAETGGLPPVRDREPSPPAA